MYKDTQSEYNLNKVASDLKDVSKLVQNNLADIIDRGGKIESMHLLLVTYSENFPDDIALTETRNVLFIGRISR